MTARRALVALVLAACTALSDDPQRSGDGGGDPNHSVDNAIAMVAGRAGGLVSGQHVVLTGRDVHPTAVLNTAMRAVGVRETLGEVTATVDELLS